MKANGCQPRVQPPCTTLLLVHRCSDSKIRRCARSVDRAAPRGPQRIARETPSVEGNQLSSRRVELAARVGGDIPSIVLLDWLGRDCAASRSEHAFSLHIAAYSRIRQTRCVLLDDDCRYVLSMSWLLHTQQKSSNSSHVVRFLYIAFICTDSELILCLLSFHKVLISCCTKTGRKESTRGATPS